MPYPLFIQDMVAFLLSILPSASVYIVKPSVCLSVRATSVSSTWRVVEKRKIKK